MIIKFFYKSLLKQASYEALRLDEPCPSPLISHNIARSAPYLIIFSILKLSILVIVPACSNIFLTTAVRGQSFSNSSLASPNSTSATEDVSQESQIPTLETQERYSTQAADLIFEPDNLVLTKSQLVQPILGVLPWTSNTNFSLEPTVASEPILAQQEEKPEEQQEQLIPPGEIVVPVGRSFGFGSTTFPPNGLNGLTRRALILGGSQTFNTLPIGLYFQQKLGDSQKLMLQAGGVDPQIIAFDLSYTLTPKSWAGGLSSNFIYQSTLFPAFQDDDVTLPRGGDAWVNTIGGGIEYFQPLGSNFDLAFGVNYEKVSVRSGMFSNEIEPVDEFGNQLTVTSGGQDDILTLRLATTYQKVNNRNYPDKGFRATVDIEQSIPVGDASITSTLLATSLAQFIPFGSSPKPSSLVLNLQGGTILGDDPPPYGAFNLGGRRTVRGYEAGRIGTGKSFIQATAEYRIPIFTFRAFKQKNEVLLNLFFDYGTDLGTADQVIGKPAVVRDRPGNGYGYGLGFQWRSRFGLFKLEGGRNDKGDTEVSVSGGTRF